MHKDFFKRLKGGFKDLRGGVVLYYPGCMTRFYLKEVFNNYKSVLSDLGVDFRTINDLKCCGSPLKNAGYTDDFEEVKKENLKLMKKYNITQIITNCPHCYDIFKKEYGIKTEHITQTLRDNKRKLVVENNEEAVYHDPCLLARENQVINEPREVLKQVEIKLREPARTKEKTFCCGAGGGVKQNSPKIANKIAKERLTQLDPTKVIVSCPYCYAHFKENNNGKRKIIELSETLVE